MSQQREVYAGPSSPHTPPAQPSKYKPTKRGFQSRPSIRDAFPDTLHPGDNDSRPSESGDERDPHDLSLSPKHAARTSIVDNMLLSLDQFAPSSVLDDYRLFNSALETDPHARHSQESSTPRRYRGHTFSSSTSSTADYGYDDGSERYGTVTPKGRRSNSSSNHQSTPRRIGSARSRDTMTARGAAATMPRTNKGSSSSTNEYAYTIPRHRPDSAIDRHSESFDCGPKRYVYTDQSLPNHLELSDDDAAPTPSVPAGPRYNRASNVASSRSPAEARRNSVKTAQAPQVRKNRPENIVTGTVKVRDDDFQQQMAETELEAPPAISASLDESAPSPTISYNKPAFPQPEPPDPNGMVTTTITAANTATPKERPGFFRRVFGGSKASSPAPAPAPAESPSSNPNEVTYFQETETKDSNGVTVSVKQRKQQVSKSSVPAPPPAPATRDGPPQVVNKKSSFFRRRKKSVVEHVPPPIVLPQEIATPQVLETMKPEPSPVSSLRRVMNPYLADSAPPFEGTKENEWEDRVRDPCYLQAQKQRHIASAPGGVSTISSIRQPPASSRSNAEAATLKGGDAESTSKDSGLLDKPRLLIPPTALSPVVEDFSRKNAPQTDVPAKDLPQESPAESNKLAPPSDGQVPDSPSASVSESSHYQTAASTPVVESEVPKPDDGAGEEMNGPGDAVEDGPTAADREQAQKLFDSQDSVVGNEHPAAWLGDPDRVMVREAYMRLYNWSNVNILAALRSLCERLVLKGETQQVDRVLDAFSNRWCDCNPSHGFKATDVVHTICYSLLLLNTDLHLADIDQKMTKSQFVRNTLPTIHRVAMDAAPDGFETLRPTTRSKIQSQGSERAPTPVKSPTFPIGEAGRSSTDMDSAGRGTADANGNTGPLVNTPFTGTVRAWEHLVEAVLKDFYTSIQKERLPLHGAPPPDKEVTRMNSTNFLGPSSGTLRRSPSTISKSGSDIFPRGRSSDSRHGVARWSSKPRSRGGRLYPPSIIGSSRTSLDDQSSVWSPTASSTWSKYSLGKFTSASVDSFGSEYPRGDYQQSIGFANALSQAIIREDSATSIYSFEESERATPLLEDETLALAGAPWAKEGSLKHKHHLDAVDKRAKDRNWNDCFAVIQQGWMRLFSFNNTTKSMRQKMKQRGGVVVGGGNWTENAEELWKFMLRQTIASALPPPGYSKSRPHVWALSLPTGAVHLFQAGTPEIVREFVSTANYWSARLSKEPLVGGISNIEYGWSDSVINSAIVTTDRTADRWSPPPSSGPRPSVQSSIRSSVDQQNVRPKLPADRVNISDWSPAQQSMVASSLTEEDQLKALQTYVKNIEDELQRHNELRSAMNLAFTPRHPNAIKAMNNWERKSSYLLREIVKFRTYMDSLKNALAQKEKIYATTNNYYKPPAAETDAASEQQQPATATEAA